jgi:hypothetical protein
VPPATETWRNFGSSGSATVSFRFASSGGIAAPGWLAVLVIGCFLSWNGSARHTRTRRPGIERIGIEMVRHAAAARYGSFLWASRMPKSVNDKFLIADNTFHQIRRSRPIQGPFPAQ